MLRAVLDAFGRTRFAAEMLERLPVGSGLVRVGGLAGSSAAVLAAWLAEQRTNRLITVVATTPAEAERWLADLSQLTDRPIALYPQREALGEEEHHVEIAGERTETIEALLGGRLDILVTTARATAERTAVPAALAAMRLELRRAEDQPLSATVDQLLAMGYERVATVLEVGQFSVRGGIVDLYGFGMSAPTRAEWWGDVIEPPQLRLDHPAERRAARRGHSAACANQALRGSGAGPGAASPPLAARTAAGRRVAPGRFDQRSWRGGQPGLARGGAPSGGGPADGRGGAGPERPVPRSGAVAAARDPICAACLGG